jgi:hypothetical protein
MRLTRLIAVTICCIAGSAHAEDPASIFQAGPISMPNVPGAFYCQQPVSDYYAINASSGFASEVVDDIPDEWDGRMLEAVTVYLAEWGGAFSEPSNVVINVYNNDCLTIEQSPIVSYVVSYGDVTATVLMDDPWSVVQLYVPLPEPIELGSTGSIGWYVENSWGQEPPYCGAILTDNNDVWGDCEAYWDGDYWGYVRWTPLSDYYGNGISQGLAYCLGEHDPSPTVQTTWGRIKSLY